MIFFLVFVIVSNIVFNHPAFESITTTHENQNLVVSNYAAKNTPYPQLLVIAISHVPPQIACVLQKCLDFFGNEQLLGCHKSASGRASLAAVQ